jgi:hypothetical protein
MSIRDFKQAASLFLDTVATFTSYELMDYQSFVTYTVLCSMIAMERPDLREKVPDFCYSTANVYKLLAFLAFDRLLKGCKILILTVNFFVFDRL